MEITKTKFGIIMNLKRAVEIMDTPPMVSYMFYTVDERRLAFEMILDNAKHAVNFSDKQDFNNVLEFKK
jgi:hypothetical protein